MSKQNIPVGTQRMFSLSGKRSLAEHWKQRKKMKSETLWIKKWAIREDQIWGGKKKSEIYIIIDKDMTLKASQSIFEELAQKPIIDLTSVNIFGIKL